MITATYSGLTYSTVDTLQLKIEAFRTEPRRTDSRLIRSTVLGEH